MTLADLQSSFTESIMNGDETGLAVVLEGGEFPVPLLMALYRESIEASLVDLLMMSGAAGLESAKAFMRANPPKTALLYKYAEAFASNPTLP